jgi:tRNA (guanine-N7-)-methyltransferase
MAQQLPPASLDEVLLYFPDPWPKKTTPQAPDRAACLRRRWSASRLKPGGRFKLATDWEPYAPRDASTY